MAFAKIKFPPTDMTDFAWCFWWLAVLAFGIVAISLFPSIHLQNSHQEKKSIDDVNINFGILLLGFGLFIGGIEVGFRDWIFTFGIKTGTPKIEAYQLVSLFFAGITCGRLIAIFLGRAITPKKFLTICLIFLLLSIFMIILYPSTSFLKIGSFLLGFFLGPAVPTILAIFAQELKLTGQMTGWFFFGMGFGSSITPYIMGLSLDVIGAKSMMVILVINNIGALIIFILIKLALSKRA
jgi:fucose permease